MSQTPPSSGDSPYGEPERTSDPLPPEQTRPYGTPPQAYGDPQPYGTQPYPSDPYGAHPYGQQAYGQPYGQPQPYGQQPYPHPAYPPSGYVRPTNAMAIVSLVLGILWIYWIGSILALVFGYVAKKQIRRTGESGGGMATAGIVLGWIGVVVLVLVIALIVVGTATS